MSGWYKVKVVENHTGIVWIEANSAKDAEDVAPGKVECTYEVTYSSEVLEGPIDDEDL